MDPEPPKPDELLEAVEDEARAQGALDDRDEPPAQKVADREAIRSDLEDEVGSAPPPGPNPS